MCNCIQKKQISDFVEIIRLPNNIHDNDLPYSEELNFKHILDVYQELFIKKEEEEENNKQWIFRGHSDSGWKLKTSIERAFDKYPLSDGKNRLDIELKMIREFKRKAHNLVPNVPEEERIFEWLSLMQHYGAPTRIMDFSYSFFVALLFAIENMVFDNNNDEDTKTCAIYAINTDLFRVNDLYKYKFINKKLRNGLNHTSPTSEETIKDFIFNKKNKPMVLHISPYLLNERMTIQQGTFLVPINIDKNFEENLVCNFDNMKNYNKQYIKKIEIIMDRNKRKELIHDLHRMNINLATLFPGIEGFARSLGMRLVMDK